MALSIVYQDGENGRGYLRVLAVRHTRLAGDEPIVITGLYKSKAAADANELPEFDNMALPYRAEGWSTADAYLQLKADRYPDAIDA